MDSKINLKVLILDRDFYALESINSYLAWDRRTRVVALVQNIDEAIHFTDAVAEAEWPDVVLLESEAFPDIPALKSAIAKFRTRINDVMVICLAHTADGKRASAALVAGARGYLRRNEVKLQIASAICYTLDYPFIVTNSIREAAPFDVHLSSANVLPTERKFPGMTDRVRQALWLCVIQGMPAQLAADEMGVSTHTVRSYIKEGYRILETYDDTDYPEEMGPLERAFMRFTALESDTGDKPVE